MNRAQETIDAINASIDVVRELGKRGVLVPPPKGSAETMTTEEKLIALADAVLQADSILDRMPEIVPPGRNRELLLVAIEGAPVLAKALKLVIELYRFRRTSDPELEERQLRRELDALVKDRE
jgi:hypothetical protein